MRLRLLIVAVVLAVTLSGTALAFQGPVTRSGDLDGDPQTETVRSANVPDPGVEERFEQTVVRISDTCPAGPVDRRITGAHDNLVRLSLLAADSLPGREVVVDLRSGAAARLGEARVVGWRASQNSGSCRIAEPLFLYRATSPTRPPRGAIREISTFSLSVTDRTSRYAGREVMLLEYFKDADDPDCCGSFRKRTYLRYVRGADRYRVYRTAIRRFRP